MYNNLNQLEKHLSLL